MDRIYTPPDLAKQLVDVSSLRAPKIIADFAAGDGELLRASSVRWPKARLIGTDICRATVRRLKGYDIGAKIGCCDFLSVLSRQRCKALYGFRRQVNLIILNPPFSCRGGKRIVAQDGDVTLYCSPALAFIVTALEFAARRFEIIAVLPAGSLTSEKDETAWQHIRKRCEVEVVSSNSHDIFSGYFPKTVIVRIGRHLANEAVATPRKSNSRSAAHSDSSTTRIQIIRGTKQMHKLEANSTAPLLPLLHTTDIGNVDFSRTKHRCRGGRSILGPVVLLPRVGYPRKERIVVYDASEETVISDCIIAIACSSKSAAIDIRRRILNRFVKLEACYGGTCAPYVTLRSLRKFLSTLGISEAASHDALCPEKFIGKAYIGVQGVALT